MSFLFTEALSAVIRIWPESCSNAKMIKLIRLRLFIYNIHTTAFPLINQVPKAAYKIKNKKTSAITLNIPQNKPRGKEEESVPSPPESPQ